MNSVRTQVGAMALTRICGAHSTAKARVRFTTAPLVVWYEMFGYSPPPDKPMIEDMLTIEPDPAFSMCRAAVRAHRNTPVMLTSTTRCQSARSRSTAGRRIAIPALLTSPSMRPSAWATASNAATIRASSDTSTA